MNRLIKQLFAGCFFCVLLSSQAAEAGNPFSNFMDNVKKSMEKRQQEPAQSPTVSETPAPTQPALPTGTVLKSANMRSGPGKEHDVVTVVPEGSVVNVVQSQGNWYQVQANNDGTEKSGWIYSSLISTSTPPATQSGQASWQTAEDASSTPTATKAGTSGTPPPTETDIQTESNINYAGYSEDFRPVKKMLENGELDKVAKHYEKKTMAAGGNDENDANVVKEAGFLQSLEQGTLAIDQGDYNKAVDYFSTAENMLEDRKNDSKLEEGVKGAGGWVMGTLLGQEEITAYKGEGWERVLMLNYKSIAYLLQGKRRAYNVTRRAIDWQNIEKKAFDQKMAEERDKAKEEINKQKAEKQDVQSKKVEAGLDAAYAPMEAKAKTVSSAYVNPFGFYVAGMIQEFESYNDRSLRDNARISYEKALELNPGSKVLKQAVKDLKKQSAPSGTRLIHIVVSDGFVPEKKVLTQNVKMKNSVIPMKLPIYMPVSTDVHRIEVKTVSGKRLATLSPVADVEAICLRQQKDVQSILTMRAMASFFVNVLAESAANEAQGIGGLLLKTASNFRQKTAAPDTRSWMSLPATMQAARLHLRKGIKSLKIETYAKNGKMLASKTVQIDPNNHDFIFARSINSMLYTQNAEKLWLAEL